MLAGEKTAHGAMVETKLPFGKRTAQRLMAIAEHPVLSNPTHVSHLPASWGTLRKHEPQRPIGLPEVLGRHGGDRRSEKAQAPGQPDQGVNHTLKRGTGNRAYTLARLRRDRPDLAERVEAGELSANAAAVEAGFRPRRNGSGAPARCDARGSTAEEEKSCSEPFS